MNSDYCQKDNCKNSGLWDPIDFLHIYHLLNHKTQRQYIFLFARQLSNNFRPDGNIIVQHVFKEFLYFSDNHLLIVAVTP